MTIAALSNDSDPDGDALTIQSVGTPANGTVTINADGTLTYMPNAGFTGTDTFTYTVSDGQGGFSTATVTVSVGTPSPDVPASTGTVPAQSGTDGAPITPVNVSTFVTDPNGDTLTFSASGLPAGLTIDPATGIISGTPAKDASQNGPYSVLVTATDPNGNQVTIPVTFAIVNPAPTAADDTAATLADVPVTIGVLGNDTDSDGDKLSVTGTTAPSNGTVSVKPDGTIVYTPNAGFTGSDTFTYTITDANGDTSTSTVTVNVGPVTGHGLAPAVNPVVGTDGETITPLTIGSMFGDPDKAGTLTYAIDTTALPPGITFDPATGTFSGTATNAASQGSTPGEPAGTYIVPITATDENGNTVTQYVTFTFTNLPTVATDDTGTVSEDGPVLTGNVITHGTTGDKDTSPDSDPLKVAAINGDAALVGKPVKGSTGGTFTVKPDGSWTFDPGLYFQNLNAGETRDTTITYLVSDGQGGTSEATITITVTGANDAPLALGPIAPQTAVEGQPITPITTADAFNNPTNLPLTFSASNLPEGLVIDPVTGVISGTPVNDASVSGPYTVMVTAIGPNGETATIPLVIGVTNPPPVAANDNATTTPATPVTLAPFANDTDPDSDPLSIASVVPPANGTVTINPNGTLTYTPNAGFTGTDTITYTVTDPQGGTSTATITVTVGTPPADAPVLAGPVPNQSATDGAPITPIDVGTLVTDPNGGPLTFSAVGLPDGLSIDPVTGVISGTPSNAASIDGPYQFTVVAVDPDGNQVTTTFVLAVANPAPDANPDAVQTPAGTPVTLAPLANDTDPDGDPLVISYVSNPANGTVVINPDGTVTYMPNAGFTGTDMFTYTVSDGQGGTVVETVTVAVGVPLPNAPVESVSTLPVAPVDGAPVTPINLAPLFSDPNVL